MKGQYDWNWAAAEKECRRALELNPRYSLAHWWLGHQLAQLGCFEEANAEFQQAQELDPLSPDIRFYAAWPAFYAHHFEGAVSQLQSLLELDPSYNQAYSLLGETYEQQGDFARATTAIQKSHELGGGVWVQAARARVLAKSGHADEAREVIADLEALWKQHDVTRYVTPYALASIHVSLGDTDHAFEWLGSACAERCEDIALIGIDPRMDALRGDSRFHDALRCAGLASD